MRFRTSASILAAAGLLLAAGGVASAQTSTTGAVRGLVKDQASGETVIGATVVASGPALQGTQATITDESGQYFVANLPPGVYQVVVYYADAQFSRTNVLIQLGKVAVVNININTQAAAGETIVIEGRAPLIDQQSTKTGSTITRDYTDNVPTGRTFGAVLGAAGGSQSDLYGTSVGGSTSVENTYIVEGVNTTDPGLGLLSTNLPNEFVQETEVITGGYNAEYGRSTGGVINVVTKSGSNEFHGSVFGYWTPGALVANEKPVPFAGSSIDRQSNLANDFDLGAEVGGPIVKDKLWFHVGLNPSFSTVDVDRIIKTQVDEDGDGVADVDENGFTVLNEVQSSSLSESAQTYFYSAKVTGAVTPDHQGSLAVMGSPGTTRDYCPFGACSNNGAESATREVVDRNLMDIALKWTSKFFDNKTQVDAVIGYHSDVVDMNPGIEGDGAGSRVLWQPDRPLTDFARFEDSFGGVPAACDDASPTDPYPMITNCPAPLYRVGGLGYIEDTDATRLNGLLAATQRVTAAGHHVFKVGLDAENMGYKRDALYTGGTAYTNRLSGAWDLRSFVTPDTMGDVPCGSDINLDGAPDANCRRIGPGEALTADTQTRNLGAFAQDSWSILPNLTLNAGIRYEQQTLYAADSVVGQLSPATGEPIPDKAFTLDNMWAPRVGVIYDWTKEGRSKVYGHYGRFYESIPMDINVRSFGGEAIDIARYSGAACDLDRPVGTCDPAGQQFDINFGGDTLYTPSLDAQYMDEIVIGTDYEVIADLKLGAAYIRRDLGRVIEDVSTDGANTYVIANPGEADTAAIADLRAESMAIRGTDPGRADFLAFQADMFEGVALFDAPKRTYNALQITAERRFTRNFMLQASYTYSVLKGNYPGLFSPETGQLDPNITSQYDLPELMANRYGNLPADRPHNLKLDGFYKLAVSPDVGYFIFGGRIRALSGIPSNTLGAQSVYGSDESYILPRGEDRLGLTTRFDSHIAYGRDLSDGMHLEAFVDVFNLFNQQPEIQVDETYTYEFVNPIGGGSKADLDHLKAFGPDGLPSARQPEVNPNYHNTYSRQAPLSARFGLRLVF
jgi:outer membrane receptor protein involved in Fe transport